MPQPTTENQQDTHIPTTTQHDPQNGEPRSTSNSFSRARSRSVGDFNTGSLQRLRSEVDPPSSSEKGPSPTMIPISNPIRTTTLDGKIAQSRAVRRARVDAIRRRRTAQHVSMFLRINLVVTPSAKRFSVTVEADRNIEYLARYVEAEYAIRYKRATTVPDGGGKKEYEPLECGLLYDVGMVPLRYTDRIGDVLNMDDVVNVLNAYEDVSNRKDSLLYLDVSTWKELDSNVVYSVGDLTGATNEKKYQLISSPTSDDRCFSVMHNKLGLEYFQQFCTRTYAVENLLFWLDTEMFQCAKSSSSALLQARYIYTTYMQANAPLQVNLTEEIRKDVPWPLPDGWIVEPTMFDEAQEHVYYILRKHIFPMFEESDLYHKFQKIKSEDRDTYEAARITGPYTDFFAPNLDVMRSCVDLVATHSPRQWGSADSNSRSDLWIKEELLDRTMNTFFRSHGPVVDYFSDSHRLTTAQKTRKVLQEKKLARFFGEKPSSDLIARQTSHNKQPPSPHASMMDDHGALRKDSNTGSVCGAGETDSEFYSRKKKVEKLEGFFGDRLGHPQLMDQKLVTSDDILPTRPMVGDIPAFSMILRRSSSSPQSLSDMISILVTSNSLSLEERRLLSKRSKKLRGILGEPLNENIVASSLTNSAKGYKSEKDLPSAVSIDEKTGKDVTDRTEMDHREIEGGKGVLPEIAHHRRLQRSQSFGSIKTVNSVLLDRNSREYRRKKLEKLYQFLGEKIPTSTLSGLPVPPENNVTSSSEYTTTDPVSNLSSKQLSFKEKQANIKRFNKLERLLGEHPPSDLISNTDTVTLQTQSIANLEKLLTGPDLVLDLVNYLSDFEQSVTTNQNRGSMATTSHAPAVQNSTNNQPSASISQPNSSLLNREVSDLEVSANADKLARQRKLQKLKRFFGDQLNPVHLVEQSILEDLEKSIDDEMTSGKDVSQVKRELRKLRDEIHKRRASLEFSSDPEDKPSLAANSSFNLPRPGGSKSSPTTSTNKFGTPTRAKLKNMMKSYSPKDAASQNSADDCPSPASFPTSMPSPSSNSSTTPFAIPPV